MEDNHSIERTIVSIPDSTMLNVERYTTKMIHVGKNVTNIPICSQVVCKNEKDKYMLLDENKIYIYDMECGELEDSVSLAKCGNLNLFSGFNYINSDTIIVFNYKERLLFCLNDKGEVFNTKKVPTNNDKLDWVSSVNALNSSRIGFCYPFLSLSGGILGVISESGIRDIPVSECVDMHENKWMPTLKYPQEYSDNNLGSVYLNRIYTTTDSKNHFYFGFPIESIVYCFNIDFTSCDTFSIQSRYDRGISVCTKNQRKLEDNDSYEIMYFVSQLSYSDILYDPYRKLIIRAVNHPLKDWKRNQKFVQPRSFIIAEEEGTILSESRIINDYADLDFGNMHICSDGLIIAQNYKDEDYILFRCYTIKNP